MSSWIFHEEQRGCTSEQCLVYSALFSQPAPNKKHHILLETTCYFSRFKFPENILFFSQTPSKLPDWVLCEEGLCTFSITYSLTLLSFHSTVADDASSKESAFSFNECHPKWVEVMATYSPDGHSINVWVLCSMLRQLTFVVLLAVESFHIDFQLFSQMFCMWSH